MKRTMFRHQGIRTAFLACSLGALAACADLGPRPGAPRVARFSLQLGSGMSADVRSIAVVISYRTAGGADRPLLNDTLEVDATATQAPVEFDIQPCFSDNSREVTYAAGACRVYIALTLLNDALLPIDSRSAAPIEISATDTQVIVPTVTFHETNSVRIAPMFRALSPNDSATLSASVLDASGAPLPGRTVTWSVTPASKATITAAGFLRVLDTGRVVVRATRDGTVDSLVTFGYRATRNTRCGGQMSIPDTSTHTIVLRQSKSPYRITSDRLYAASENITIEPGTVVCVDSARIVYSFTPLKVNGTVAQRVYLTASDTTKGWGGLFLIGPVTDSTRIDYTTFEYIGISAQGTGALVSTEGHPVVLQNVTVRRGSTSIGVAFTGTRSGGRIRFLSLDTVNAQSGTALYINRYVTLDTVTIRRAQGIAAFVAPTGDNEALPTKMHIVGLNIIGPTTNGLVIGSERKPLAMANVNISQTDVPVQVTAGFLGGWRTLATTNITGNLRDTIDVISGGIVNDTVVLTTGVPWRIMTTLNAGINGQLQIRAGARVSFFPGALTRGIYVSGAGSSLVISGTQANPVILTSNGGRWGGVEIIGATDSSKITGARFSTGGGTASLPFFHAEHSGWLTIDSTSFIDVGRPALAINLTGGFTFMRSSVLNSVTGATNGPALLIQANAATKLQRLTLSNLGQQAIGFVTGTPSNSITMDSVHIGNVGSGVSFQTANFGTYTLHAINFDTVFAGPSVTWTSSLQLDARNLFWGFGSPPPSSGAGSASGNIAVSPVSSSRFVLTRVP